MNAWLPQASYPCGNFSDTSSLKFLKTKGSIGHAFTVCIHTENQNQMSFYPFVLHEISVLIELILGHLCFLIADVPPQPNSPPGNVFNLDCECRGAETKRGYSSRLTSPRRPLGSSRMEKKRRMHLPPMKRGKHTNLHHLAQQPQKPFSLRLDPHMRNSRNSRNFEVAPETPPN